MAEVGDKEEKVTEVETVSDKNDYLRPVTNTEDSAKAGGLPAVRAGTRGLQPPEFLLNMTMEQRMELESRLKRKIDLRLLPCIILMYILNYIDRYVSRPRRRDQSVG